MQIAEGVLRFFRLLPSPEDVLWLMFQFTALGFIVGSILVIIVQFYRKSKARKDKKPPS